MSTVNFYTHNPKKELYKLIYLKFIAIMITRLIINFSGKLFDFESNKLKIDFTSALKITSMCILKEIIYENFSFDRYQKFYLHLFKIYKVIVPSIPYRSFLHKPTKEHIENNIKEKLKIITKINVKEKVKIDIYKKINIEDESIFSLVNKFKKKKEKTYEQKNIFSYFED